MGFYKLEIERLESPHASIRLAALNTLCSESFGLTLFERQELVVFPALNMLLRERDEVTLMAALDRLWHVTDWSDEDAEILLELGQRNPKISELTLALIGRWYEMSCSPDDDDADIFRTIGHSLIQRISACAQSEVPAVRMSAIVVLRMLHFTGRTTDSPQVRARIEASQCHLIADPLMRRRAGALAELDVDHLPDVECFSDTEFIHSAALSRWLEAGPVGDAFVFKVMSSTDTHKLYRILNQLSKRPQTTSDLILRNPTLARIIAEYLHHQETLVRQGVLGLASSCLPVLCNIVPQIVERIFNCVESDVSAVRNDVLRLIARNMGELARRQVDFMPIVLNAIQGKYKESPEEWERASFELQQDFLADRRQAMEELLDALKVYLRNDNNF